jgi:3-oxoacyl-[acyl-carrier protein] reductase
VLTELSDARLGMQSVMDLGLSGRKGIVCAASKGLGRAVAVALAREGVELVINARSEDALKVAAEQIHWETGVDVIPIAADITTEAGREAVLGACPDPDILINNAGGPPPGDFRQVRREDWIRAVDANMLTPIFLIRAVVDGMIARGFGRIINITTMGVKSPGTYPQLGVSIGVRSGLTGFVGVLSRQTARHNVTINGLLPGRFETDRLRENLEFAARAAGHSAEEEAVRVRDSIPAGGFGTPKEFGAFAAFLCSIHAGYLTGQNIVLDGGVYPGLI